MSYFLYFLLSYFLFPLCWPVPLLLIVFSTFHISCLFFLIKLSYVLFHISFSYFLHDVQSPFSLSYSHCLFHLSYFLFSFLIKLSYFIFLILISSMFASPSSRALSVIFSLSFPSVIRDDMRLCCWSLDPTQILASNTYSCHMQTQIPRQVQIQIQIWIQQIQI